MTVYVDDAAIPFKGKPRFHLSADSLEEMHAFCARVGINRCWFHRQSAYPHYDVTSEQREAALAAGAKAVTKREMPAISKKLRPAKAPVQQTLV